MRAMIFREPNSPLTLEEMAKPLPTDHEILVQVSACGVCRTDLHIFRGELSQPKIPLILGHQIVGKVVQVGKKVKHLKINQRVGIPWLGQTCEECAYCKQNQENLCDKALFTGYQKNGGFAEYCVANSSFSFPLPEAYDDIHVAPFLCAGLIGFRALSMIKDAQHIGFYGFGSSAHILTQILKAEHKSVYAFTKQGDHEKQMFALALGAVWSGSIDEIPQDPLDAAIIFAPSGALIPLALKSVRKGGVVVSAGIHMSDIPSFPYRILWEERVVRSVSNLTRKDATDFFSLATRIPIKTEVTKYSLERANEALEDLEKGRFKGSAVLVMDKPY
jgi:propanol-preferring alcohol dehydrogenase